MLRSLLIFCMIFATLPVILIKPHVGVLVWSWVSYMNPHRLTYGFAYAFSFLVIAGGLTLIAAVISREPKKIPNHPLVWLMAIFFLWTTLTTITGVYEDPWEKWERVAKQTLFTFLTLMFLMSRNRLHALLWVIVLSMGFFAMKGGLFTVLTAGAHRVWGPPNTFYSDNNHFALAMCMVLPLVRYLHMQATQKYLRWFLIGMLLLGFFSIFGTHSRGALVGVTAMVLFLVIKSRNLVFGLFVIVAVGGIAFAFMPDEWHERMATITDYESDVSATGRLDMWAFAIEVANQHPIVGGGYDVFYDPGYRAAFLPEGVQGRAAHSIYFETLGEHGYIGLALFLLLGVSTYLTCSTTMRQCKNNPDVKWAHDFSAMIQVGLVGYATAGAFLNVATFDLYFHLIAMTIMVRVLANRQLEKVEGEAAWTPQTARGPTTPLRPSVAPPLARR